MFYCYALVNLWPFNFWQFTINRVVIIMFPFFFVFYVGYVYDFPFLSPNCGISVEKGKYIYPLYRHLIHAKFPSMAFIGIPFTVCPFPQFDIQVNRCIFCIHFNLTIYLNWEKCKNHWNFFRYDTFWRPSKENSICHLRKKW